MPKRNDLQGKVFGRLTVLHEAGRTKDRHILWECECTCGNIAYVNSRDLINGHTQSCGCLSVEAILSDDFKVSDDGEFLLYDRIEKIKSVFNQYGEENFFISFSGGKDSSVLSALVDMAVPKNKIPRVYSDTGIELNMIRDYVYGLQKTDDRIQIVKPKIPIKRMLEEDGYPFKSKRHSRMVYDWWNKENRASAEGYYKRTGTGGVYACPKVLKYQFDETPPFKISPLCCDRLKKEPINKWKKENGKRYSMTGIMAAEGGQRDNAKCLVFNKSYLKAFQPLAPVDKPWENWFIKAHNVQICDIYKPPYNFRRTGCKGCPFIPDLQTELNILEAYFPAERRQCEVIWKPVYAEYRRLRYRLKEDNCFKVKDENPREGIKNE